METQTITPQTPALTLDSADLSQADYRALREGREVPKPVEVEPSSPAADAATLTPAETAVEDGTEPNSEETPKQEPKPKGDKLAGRFSELTAQIRELKTQLAAKSGAVEASKIEVKPAAVETPVIPPDPKDPEPDASKFDNYTDWQKAWMRWDRRQESRAEVVARAAAEQQTAAAAKASTWNEKVTAASAEMADFAEVAQNPDLPVTPVMGEAILDSELGPKILYHLGQNPTEAARIAKLSPVAQVREITKLEAMLSPETAKPADEKPQTKSTTVSKAPAPIRPVAGGASASNPVKSIDSMSQAEYRAYRESGRIR